jgi:hypothetical protein
MAQTVPQSSLMAAREGAPGFPLDKPSDSLHTEAAKAATPAARGTQNVGGASGPLAR